MFVEKRSARRMARTAVAAMILLAAAMLLAGGCGQSKPEPAKGAPPPAVAAVSGEQSPALAEKPGEWKADGTVSDGEYRRRQVFGSLEVFSRIDGDKVRIALRAKTNGYVAIGFDPSERMKDADIVLGFVKDGQAVVTDMFSTGVTGPHPPDDQQGGRNDVTVFGGSKKDGVTVIEFERLLTTGDPRDKAVKAGSNRIIWAVGDTESAAVKHVQRGAGILDL